MFNWLKTFFVKEKTPYQLLLDLAEAHIADAKLARNNAIRALDDGRAFTSEKGNEAARAYEKKAMEIIEQAEKIRLTAQALYGRAPQLTTPPITIKQKIGFS